MYDDEDSREGIVRAKVNGPFGPTWVVLNRFSRLSDMELVLKQKTEEFETSENWTEQVKDIRQRNPDFNRTWNPSIQTMMEDPDLGPDIYKLCLWISDKKADSLRRTAIEKEEWLQNEAGSFDKTLKQKTALFERLLNEELQGKRITIYQADRMLTSLTEESPVTEMETVLSNFSDGLSEKQVKSINDWMSRAKEMTPDEIRDKPIRLPYIDGTGFFELSKDTDPDMLQVAIQDRSAELGKEKLELIEAWIKESRLKTPDSEDRIRVFHKGLDRIEDSTQIYLDRYDIDFVEKLQRHLTSSDTALLPEHKQRLDKRYDQLLEDRQSPDWKEPETLQVPAGEKGRTLVVSKDMPEHVLDVVYKAYAYDLTEENRELLWRWRSEAKFEPLEPHTVRAYEIQDLTRFQTFHRYKHIAEIEKALKSQDWFFKYDNLEKAQNWVDSLEPLFPKEPDKQTAILTHSTGLTFSVTLETVQSDPSRVSEALSDSNWTTTERNRALIETWLHRAERNPEEEIVLAGEVINRNQPLAQLKELADAIAEGNFPDLSPEAGKKLLTWIHTKEKFGDDYYKDKPAAEPQALPPSRYDRIFGDKSKLDSAMFEILTDIGKELNKNKPKDKDEPFPAI